MPAALQLVLALVLIFAASVCARAEAPQGVSTARALAVTFNDGWRWAYRARVVDMLKPDIYRADTIREAVFRAELGLTSKGREGLTKDADTLFALLKDKGDEAGAEVLEALITFYDGSDTSSLETALRLHPGSGCVPLGWYLLGDRYEKMGFYPEAEGYYNRLYNEAPEGRARTAGLFQLSRVRYFKGEYEAAKELLKEAVKAGSAGAPLWLANTLLIKGEFSSARSIYAMARINEAGADPLTLLSMGDMAVINGEFDRARSIFELLRARYSTDQFLAAFFDLKRGDAYAAEGSLAEALAIYRKTKENLNMLEGWAMASLSIADVYASKRSGEDLMKAYDLYSTVASGGYIGSERANLLMARTALKAGLFARAFNDAKAFPAGYPSSRLKDDMDALTGDIVVDWMESMYAGRDYYSIVKLFIEQGGSIPFGKRANSYLIAGKSYAALGLDSDAVNVLDSAVKISRGAVQEEAMVRLADVYISQKDWNSAERLVKALKAKFPASAYGTEVEKVLLKAALIKKDYKRAAVSAVKGDDAESLMIQAFASAKLGRVNAAKELYSMALKALGAEGAKDTVAEAYTGVADASFSLGRYEDAIRAYRKAVDAAGPELKRERSWALYRIAKSFERIADDGKKEAALEELGGIKGDISNWAEMIFKQEQRM